MQIKVLLHYYYIIRDKQIDKFIQVNKSTKKADFINNWIRPMRVVNC